MGAALSSAAEAGKQWLARSVLVPWWAWAALPVSGDSTHRVSSCLRGRSVRVAWDAWGVPHVEGESAGDVIAAQGWCHARDRLFQMEIMRRLGQGRISELRGPSAVGMDRFARTLGWRRLAEQDYDHLKTKNKSQASSDSIDDGLPDDLDLLESYVAGVNAFIQEARALPWELRAMSVRKLEPWSVVDVLTACRLLCFQMTFGFQSTILRQELIQLLGPAAAVEWGLAEGAESDALRDIGSAVPDEVPMEVLDGAMGATQPPREQGSNWWVISGDRTDTKRPILANDPHLAVAVPVVWYETHLKQVPSTSTPSSTQRLLHVTGVTIAGVPGVIVGHNEHAGWGVTLGFTGNMINQQTHVEDVFAEVFTGDVDPRLGIPRTYLHKGELLEASVRKERILIKGKFQTMHVIETVHGPIIDDSSLLNLSANLKRVTANLNTNTNEINKSPRVVRLALCSTTLSPNLHLIPAVKKLAYCRNPQEFRDAMALITAPPLNFCYADVDNNIAWALTGSVPVRKYARGLEQAVLPGWTGEHDWKGFVSWDEMPHALNPPEGRIHNANHRAIDNEYPHYLGHVWKDPWRARGIEQDLASRESSTHTLQQSEALQVNVRTLAGLAFLDACRGVSTQWEQQEEDKIEESSEEQLVREAWERLMKWDGQLDVESVPGCLYEVLHTYVVQNLLVSGLESALQHGTHVQQLQGDGMHPAIKKINEFQGHIHGTVLRILSNPDSWWAKTAGGRAALLKKSLRDAVQHLCKTLGPDMNMWQWGRLHTCQFRHPFSSTLGCSMLDVPTFAYGGDTNTPQQAAYSADMTFVANSVASYRQVLDVGNWSACRSVLPIGQSGQYGSRHYRDQTEMWAEGRYKPMLWEEAEVAAHTVHTDTLMRAR
eukprot:jgi/Chlat1/6213/Chrsp44S05751